MAYNDGYNVPMTPQFCYRSKEEAVKAAADMNIEQLANRELIFPPLDSELVSTRRKMFYFINDSAVSEQDREGFIEDVPSGLAHLSDSTTVEELREHVMAIEDIHETAYNWEGDWYSVAELRIV